MNVPVLKAHLCLSSDGPAAVSVGSVLVVFSFKLLKLPAAVQSSLRYIHIIFVYVLV